MCVYVSTKPNWIILFDLELKLFNTQICLLGAGAAKLNEQWISGPNARRKLWINSFRAHYSPKDLQSNCPSGDPRVIANYRLKMLWRIQDDRRDGSFCQHNMNVTNIDISNHDIQEIREKVILAVEKVTLADDFIIEAASYNGTVVRNMFITQKCFQSWQNLVR